MKMAKIIDVDVDMMEQFNAASPQIIVLFDKDDFFDIKYQERENVYLGILEDRASFYYYEKPGSGFGGRRIEVEMVDGSKRVLIGPWSGNSDSVNHFFPEFGIIEITSCENKKNWDEGDRYGCGGAVLIAPLAKKLKEKGYRCGIINTGYGNYFEVLRENGTPKCIDSKVIKEF
jgi:hypothetical protein